MLSFSLSFFIISSIAALIASRDGNPFNCSSTFALIASCTLSSSFISAIPNASLIIEIMSSSFLFSIDSLSLTEPSFTFASKDFNNSFISFSLLFILATIRSNLPPADALETISREFAFLNSVTYLTPFF